VKRAGEVYYRVSHLLSTPFRPFIQYTCPDDNFRPQHVTFLRERRRSLPIEAAALVLLSSIDVLRRTMRLPLLIQVAFLTASCNIHAAPLPSPVSSSSDFTVSVDAVMVAYFLYGYGLHLSTLANFLADAGFPVTPQGSGGGGQAGGGYYQGGGGGDYASGDYYDGSGDYQGEGGQQQQEMPIVLPAPDPNAAEMELLMEASIAIGSAWAVPKALSKIADHLKS
jgi:hypothetical protein